MVLEHPEISKSIFDLIQSHRMEADKLYSEISKDNLRSDLNFVSHIGVGNSVDKVTCKKMVHEWNKDKFEIKGKVLSLEIVAYNLVWEIDQIKM